MTSRKDSPVFQSAQIGNFQVKNRLVRSATHENAAKASGEPSEELFQLYRSLAEGGVGLIITGIFGVCSDALMPNSVRIDDDRYIGSVREISDLVHRCGNGCKITAQLWHPGRQVADPKSGGYLLASLPPALLSLLAKQAKEAAVQGAAPKSGPAHPVVEPVAPSEVFDNLFKRTPRALTLEEIERIIDSFAHGIRRAQEAGFDGVQLHAAHGYLLSSFLSPHTNRRMDSYGGSTENRARIVTEIYRRGRKLVGNDFPIMIKFNSTDFLSGGMDTDEAIRLAAIFAETGFAALEVSGGMWEAVTRTESELGWKPFFIPESRTNINSKEKEAYFASAAKAIKQSTSVPVMLVGGLRSLDKIEEILNDGTADFISMSRPLIRQPELPNLWLSGNGPARSECASCNGCLPFSGVVKCRALNK